MHPGRCAAIRIAGREVGVVGELHPRWRQKWELPHTPLLFELDLALTFILFGFFVERSKLFGDGCSLFFQRPAQDFGCFRFAEDIIPTAENPKTGRLIAMALVKTVRQLRSTLVVGA